MTREIPLTRGYVALVDDEDYVDLAPFNWYALVQRWTIYAARRGRIDGGWATEYMHRRILGGVPGDRIEIDHRDGNGLNNTRANLRRATTSENQRNRSGLQRNNTSGYVGVVLNKRNGRWRAEVVAEGRLYSAGGHEMSELAALARDELARRLHGEFAVLNFP